MQKLEFASSNLKFLLIFLALSGFVFLAVPILDEDVGLSVNYIGFGVVPGILLVVLIILSRKLIKNHSRYAKPILLFTIAMANLFVAEQLWTIYEVVLEEDPFPSMADVFYLAAYPFLFGFVILSIKRTIKSIPISIVLFGCFLSVSVLVPTFLFTYELNAEENTLDLIVALSYPVADAILFGLVIISLLVFFKAKMNYFWILIIVGAIMMLVADTIFLHLIFTDQYESTNPVDVLWIWNYVIWIFAVKHYYSSKNLESKIISWQIHFENKYKIVIGLSVISFLLVAGFIQMNYFFTDATDLDGIQNSYFIMVFLILTAALTIFSLKTLSIKIKLTTTVVLIISIFLLQSFYSFYLENEIADVAEYHNMMSLPAILLLDQLNIQHEKLYRISEEISNTAEHEGEYESTKNQLSSLISQYVDLSISKNSNGEYLAPQKMRLMMNEYVDEMTESLDRTEKLLHEYSLTEQNFEDFETFEDKLHQEYEYFIDVVLDAKNMELDGGKMEQNTVNYYLTINQTLQIYTIIFVIGSVVLSMTLVFRSIAKKIWLISKITEDFSNGKFDSRIHLTGGDELDIIAQRIESMGEKLDNNQNELLKTERLKSIGALASRLAHDLRNPLSIIKTTNEVIRVKTGKDKYSQITKNTDFINKAVDRMSYQIDSVLDFIRTKPLVLEEHSIQSIIEKTIETIKVPENVTIDLEKNDVKVTCDLQRITIVFINLITNAIQAIDKNSGRVTIRIKDNDDQVSCEIIDSGPGIPEDMIDKVFEPLFTTKQTGTGLGLASCKSVIEQHSGTISIYNNPTTFTVTLPKIIKVQQIQN